MVILEVALTVAVFCFSMWACVQGQYRAGDALDVVLDSSPVGWVGVIFWWLVSLAAAGLGTACFVYWIMATR